MQKLLVNARPWLTLAIISGALLLIGLDMTVLNVVLPSLALELGASNSDKLWMVNAYSLVMAGLLPGFGTLGDKIGHRTILLAGLAVFGAASVVAAFAPTPAIVIVARAMLAVGAAMMMPATLSIVRIIFVSDQQRATAIGIWGAVWGGAAALGPILGGVLLAHFWWGSVFLINLPIVLIVFCLTLIHIPHLPGNSGRHWDAITSGLLTISLIGFLYALKSVLKPEIYWPGVSLSFLAGLLSGWTFIRRQACLPAPLIDFSLFRNSRFSLGTIVAVTAGFAFMGLQYVLSQELQLVRGLSPLAAGLFVLPLAAASFLAGPVVGRYMLRAGIERMVAITVGISAVGMGVYAYSTYASTLIWEIATLVIIGIGAGGSMSVASTAVMLSAPEEKAGMAGSIESVAYELGSTIGVAVMGSVVASVYARDFFPPASVQLPASAWDSLDKALIALQGLPPEVAIQVARASKSAFSTGATITFTLAALALFLLFIFVIFRALKPRLKYSTGKK